MGRARDLCCRSIREEFLQELSVSPQMRVPVLCALLLGAFDRMQLGM